MNDIRRYCSQNNMIPWGVFNNAVYIVFNQLTFLFVNEKVFYNMFRIVTSYLVQNCFEFNDGTDL